MSIEMTRGISDITESAIDRQYREMEFLYTLMEQEREMEQYVNECLIKASGNQKAIQEMTLLEATSGGDKIKGFFDKIKNFFKKIFDKLGASLNGVFMEQKKYIDKYNAIITKSKWQQGDVSDIKDRFKGLPRILDAVDKADQAILGTNLDTFFKQEKINDSGVIIDTKDYESADNIEQAYARGIKKKEANATRDQVYTDFISKSGYWDKVDDFGSYKQTDSNGVINTSTTFGAWFDGSIDTVTYSADDIENNFQTIINVTYNGDTYMKRLEKIVGSVNRKMDEASKAMEDYFKAQQDKIMTAVKGKGSDTVEKAKEEEQEASAAVADASTGNGNTQQVDSQGQATKITGDDFFIEVEFGSNNSASSPEKGTSLANNSVDDNNAAAKAGENINKKQVNKFNAKDVANVAAKDDNHRSDLEKKAKELLDTDIYNRKIMFNESINISTTIVRRMFDAFKNMNSEFFKIIQAHVQWYLGNPGESGKNENNTTRVRNLNSMNATGNNTVQQKPKTKTEESKPEGGQPESSGG